MGAKKRPSWGLILCSAYRRILALYVFMHMHYVLCIWQRYTSTQESLVTLQIFIVMTCSVVLQHLMALCNGPLIVDSIVVGQHEPTDKAVKFIQTVDVKMAPQLNLATFLLVDLNAEILCQRKSEVQPTCQRKNGSKSKFSLFPMPGCTRQYKVFCLA